ncbi:MAG: XdhC family protein [Acidimicrobiia bacterium]|nr:XdhC family protein [Acidimicrobiia bacterium]
MARPAEHVAPMGGQDQRVLRELSDAVAGRLPVVLATVVDTRRSVPRHAGAKMLVYQDGRLTGTVGGGEMESRVIDEARTLFTTRRPQLLDYALVDPGRGDPGVCGGEVRIYLEPYMPAHTIVVIGAGHVGRAVVDLADWLGYQTAVIDDRPERLTEEEMPNAGLRLTKPIADALAGLEITEDTSVAVVTRSVDKDVEAIPVLLKTPARYIGVMGSERRWREVTTRLAALGLGEVDLERVHAPIGLDIHAETLEEIAVSILSEIIRARGAGTEA